MADLSQALSKLLELEGEYSRDPKDFGGETYCGISRRLHPKWPGWKRVDCGESIGSSPRLWQFVLDFYNNEFWRVVWGDRQPDQEVAFQIFEFAVNCGNAIAIRSVQVVANALNRQGELFRDIVEDGIWGHQTFAALLTLLDTGDREAFLTALNAEQGHHYITLTRKNNIHERTLRGWLKRVTLT